MIQINAFNMSKQKARLSLASAGTARDSFVYWGDVKNQWNDSYSSAKILELIESQSVPNYNLPDVQRWLGKLTPQEDEFSKRFTNFYEKLAGMVTSVETSVLSSCDLAETLLDMRVLQNQVEFPCKVLDIGPGAGRHLVNMFLNPYLHDNIYVGIESIGLPYTIQNMIASTICFENERVKFFDCIDYEFARKEFIKIKDISPNSIVHMPLWQDNLLPRKYFDLIICNYVLDEVSAEDFHRITNIISSCLSDNGIVYCRGAQQRASLKGLYYYGYGTFHGQDITKTIISKDMKMVKCEIIASQLTRLFSRKSSKKNYENDGKYTHLEADLPLTEELQKDFIAANINELEGSGKKVLIWGEPGYEFFSKYIKQYRDKLNIIGLMTRYAHSKVKTSFGFDEHPTSDFATLSPDVVIITSMRDVSILRQIREMASPEEFKLMRKFNYPIAFVYRN